MSEVESAGHAGESLPGPALAMLELADVPAGYAALDALVKEAPVSIIAAGTVQCGHFLIAFAGEVEPVEMSFTRALRVADRAILDVVLLPHAEPRILPALIEETRRFPASGDALGVLQTSSSPTLLRAVDAALKGAEVELVELRIAEGLAGRGLATLWGNQHDMQAAIDLATDAFTRGRREGCTTAVIPNADHEVGRALRRGTRFFKELRG
ncbi:Propanediol utilization polyhedral body protein PduT [Minicystis rosea]|nr:Propanediol utilization polyhedral body protein PduT [Minicystis rosea]